MKWPLCDTPNGIVATVDPTHDWLCPFWMFLQSHGRGNRCSRVYTSSTVLFSRTGRIYPAQNKRRTCCYDRELTWELWQLCCVPITSCKRCARLSQLCKPFHSRSHWEFPICTSGEVETVFLIQSAPLGKRWRRFAENLILSLFNFNFVGRDSSYSRAGGGY